MVVHAVIPPQSWLHPVAWGDFLGECYMQLFHPRADCIVGTSKNSLCAVISCCSTPELAAFSHSARLQHVLLREAISRLFHPRVVCTAVAKKSSLGGVICYCFCMSHPRGSCIMRTGVRLPCVLLHAIISRLFNTRVGISAIPLQCYTCLLSSCPT